MSITQHTTRCRRPASSSQPWPVACPQKKSSWARQPSSGQAQIDGLTVGYQNRQIRPVIGYVPDFMGAYEDMVVMEYLQFCASAYGIHGRERMKVVGDVLELTDLAYKSAAEVNSLSRGMQQRLGLARTLVHDPKVLLLDEPASGLDPQARIDLRVLLTHLQQQGKTLLVSSHILSELEQICTRVVVIESGGVRFAGSLSEISESLVERRVEVRLLDEAGAESAHALLGGIELVDSDSLEVSGSQVSFRAGGSESEIADVLGALVGAGVRVFSFEVQKPSLESLFLDVTRGEVR